MKANVGTTDRIVRVLGGLLLIALSVTDVIGPWGWLGLVPLATGMAGWCPPYALLGISTCKVRH